MGALQRVQLADNVVTGSGRSEFDWFIPYMKSGG
jgi:hypothetical protein